MAKTEAEVTETMEQALRVIGAAGVPENLQETAFERALDLLTGASAAPQAGSVAAAPKARAMAAPGSEQPTGDLAARVAGRIGAEAADVGRVLDFDEQGVHLMAPRSRFSRSKASATQEVALLVVAARQGAGLDEDWTSQQYVRDAAERLGVEDPSNFAAHLKRLQGVRTKGSGKAGEIRMNAVGFEAAGELITALARET